MGLLTIWGSCEYESVVFFFKQKTAYEVRISDWSSDVCSSDLLAMTARQRRQQREFLGGEIETLGVAPRATTEQIDLQIADRDLHRILAAARSEEHTSELQSLMRISYAVFCLKKRKNTTRPKIHLHTEYTETLKIYHPILI